MKDYNKIIESVKMKFLRAKEAKLNSPIQIKNYYDVANTIIFQKSGNTKFRFNKKETVVSPGSILFIPGGKIMEITFGEGDANVLSNEEFFKDSQAYLNSENDSEQKEFNINFEYISFEAKVFDSVNFFTSIDIPPFVIDDNQKIKQVAKMIFEETSSEEPGKERLIKVATETLVIEVIRHMIREGRFVEQLATNSSYFKDPRLIDIFSYIKENLNGDLSNKKLAAIANVSEDYVGQYFKMLTGINPQDYIEYQRMEEAVNLLRTTKKSIRSIGQKVGYKDTAYFCRRFKMMFGIPAGKMRRRDSLMNV
ncbi:MAG: AraC family transcriptional regulator [Cyclobacteriaceae bacterium]|nr:helix-turn-helix transcriptional regulator [Cyclobacteriaceae bacterium]MCH8517430.1 AraC family transcriptional regulator [Cyclobacteriaceae bacterium]